MGDKPIPLDRFTSILRQLCLPAGPQPFPRKRLSRHVVLKSASLVLDEGRHYDQQSIDRLLKKWLSTIGQVFGIDHVQLRRLLIEYGYLLRRPDGSSYWRAPCGAGAGLFTAEVDRFDFVGFRAEMRRLVESRRPKLTPTTLYANLTQELPGREKTTVEWKVATRGRGEPGDRARQLQEVEWCLAGAEFLGLLPELLQRATGLRIEYAIEWVVETTFLDDEALATMRAVWAATYSDPSDAPVLVLCAIREGDVGSEGFDEPEPRRSRIACCVPRFPARGERNHITAQGAMAVGTDKARFAFCAIDSVVDEVIRATAAACGISVEPLAVRGCWKPRMSWETEAR